jgi:hypothetical protein
MSKRNLDRLIINYTLLVGQKIILTNRIFALFFLSSFRKYLKSISINKPAIFELGMKDIEAESQ